MPDSDRFLSRWSRRKIVAREGGQPSAEPDQAPSTAPAGVEQAPPSNSAAEQAAPVKADETRMLTEADFADVDFEALDAASDYGRFVRANVPDVIRNKALARLWTSDPVFAGADPIHDYHGDFTDAAVAVQDGLRTAYRVGIGFLTDEEVAERDQAAGADKQAGVDPSPVAGRSAVVDGGTADHAAAVSQPDDDPVPEAPDQRAGIATPTLAAAVIRKPSQPTDSAKDAGEPEKS